MKVLANYSRSNVDVIVEPLDVLNLIILFITSFYVGNKYRLYCQAAAMQPSELPNKDAWKQR